MIMQMYLEWSSPGQKATERGELGAHLTFHFLSREVVAADYCRPA